MSLIDVILPTYNNAKFLDRAISHILSQTFLDFSFIIVNDGSVDNTGEILSAWKDRDPRITVIDNVTNKGLPHSLNAGHKNSISPYCTWVSTDNISYSNHLTSLYECMIRGNFDFTQGDYVIKDAGNTQYVKVRGRKENWGCGILGPSFLYNRRVWDAYHYDESLQCVEDLKFYLQAFLHPFKFGYVDEYLVEYYVHPDSLTAKVHKDLTAHYKKVDRVYEDVVKPHLDRIK